MVGSKAPFDSVVGIYHEGHEDDSHEGCRHGSCFDADSSAASGGIRSMRGFEHEGRSNRAEYMYLQHQSEK